MKIKNVKPIIKALPDIKDQIMVFDDLLPNHLIKYIKKIINKTPFALGDTDKGTSGYEKDFFVKNEINNIRDDFQLCNLMYDDPHMQDLDFPLIDNIDKNSELLIPLYSALSNMGCCIPSINPYIQRIKTNLQSSNKFSNNETYNFPHIDNKFYNSKALTILYYVNDSDGDTFFFNEKTYNNIEELKNLTIREKISPKEGRLVVFRSDILHAGSHPINSSYRVVINYNLFPVKLWDKEQTGENLLKDLAI